MEIDKSRFNIKTLLAEMVEILARSWWRVGAAFIVMCTSGVLIDLKTSNSSANMLFTFVAVLFQFWLTSETLIQFGMRGADTRRSSTVIWVTLLSQLAILLGLILLIVPGLIAFVRWSMVVPIALSERVGAIEAMKRSWKRSEGHFWPMLGLLMLVYIPMFGLALGVGLLVGSMSVLADILINALACVGLIGGWYVAIALFFATEPSDSRISEGLRPNRAPA